jgi:predicted ester cyclase
MMTADERKGLVQRWFDTFNTGDFSQLAEIHATDCRNHAHPPFDVSEWPAEGKPFGPEAFRSTVEWVRASQPDLEVTLEATFVDGDEVVAWIRSRGTATGSGGPIPPTGAQIDFAQAHRFRIADGRIVEHWAVRDDLRSMIQAGVIERPGGQP